MRPLLVVLVLVALAGAGADGVATAFAERRLSREATAVLQARTRVDVHSWPATWYVMTGRPVEVALRARRVPIDGSPARIDVVRAQLPAVAVSLGQLTGSPQRLRLRRPGRFVADLYPATVADLVDVEGVGLVLRDGALQATVRGLPIPLRIRARVRRGRIVLAPQRRVPALDVRYIIDPQLPEGLVVRAADVTTRRLRITGRVDSLPVQAG